MRFQDTPELATWRAQVRQFVDSNWRAQSKPGEEEDSMEGPTDMRRTKVWLDKLAENGWIAAAWPKKYGGADMSVLEQFVLNQEFHEARSAQACPRVKCSNTWCNRTSSMLPAG